MAPWADLATGNLQHEEGMRRETPPAQTRASQPHKAGQDPRAAMPTFAKTRVLGMSAGCHEAKLTRWGRGMRNSDVHRVKPSPGHHQNIKGEGVSWQNRT